MNNEQRVGRRTFIDWLLAGGLFTWLVGFVAPVISYIRPAQHRGPAQHTVSAGKAEAIEEWQSKIVALGGHPVIVIRTPQGFNALSAICTHLGCIVQWDNQRRQISCPCHAGFFDVNGRVISGPPPRPLTEYNIMVVGGEVIVKSA